MCRGAVIMDHGMYCDRVQLLCILELHLGAAG